MKNYGFLLFVTLASANLFGQNKLIKTTHHDNTSINKEYEYKFKDTVVSIMPKKGLSLFDRKGLDLAHLADSVFLKTPQDTASRLFQVIEYNQSNQPTKIFYNETDTTYNTKEYTYHNNGFVASEKLYHTDSTFSQVDLFDTLGRRTQIDIFLVLNQTDTHIYNRVYRYDSLRLLGYNDSENYNATRSWYRVDSSEYYYTGNSKLPDSIRIITRNTFANLTSSWWAFDYKYYYQYNAEGKVIYDSLDYKTNIIGRNDYESVIVRNFTYNNDSTIIQVREKDIYDTVPNFTKEIIYNGPYLSTNDSITDHIVYKQDSSLNITSLASATGSLYDYNGYLKSTHHYNLDTVLNSLIKVGDAVVYRNMDMNVDSIVTDSTKIVNEYIGTTSVKNITLDSYKIYPNPSTGIFTVEAHKTNRYNVIVYDAMGRLIGSFIQAKSIDLTHQPAGNYILRIVDEDSKLSFIHHIIKH